MPVKHRRSRTATPEDTALLAESRRLRLQMDQIAPAPARAEAPAPTPEQAVAEQVMKYLEPHRAAFPDSRFHRTAPAAGGDL